MKIPPFTPSSKGVSGEFEGYFLLKQNTPQI